MKFKGDIIITDPCYIIRAAHHGTKPITKDDWKACNYGKNMDVLGIYNYICRSTIYGDWSCTTYNSDTNEKIGEFCADAGLVGVFELNEVLKYNPDFNYHICRPWTTTWIKNFDGEVNIKVVNNEYGESEVQVIGKGNINFLGRQTDF